MIDFQNGKTSSNSLQEYGQTQKAPLQTQGQTAFMGVQRQPVSRQDLVDMSLKLQEALSLVTQALGRML